MRMKLLDLLSANEIIHPTRLIRLESRGDGNLLLEVEGFPWWRPTRRDDSERKIRFYFEGVDGRIDPEIFSNDPYDEFLEIFEARPLSELPWAMGAYCHLYCRSPIENPLSIYAELHDFLVSVHCPFPPDYYFNFGEHMSLTSFIDIVSTSSFLLLEGPESVAEVVATHLAQYGVKFNLIRDETPSDCRVWVQLGGSQIICQSAYSVFEDDIAPPR